MALRSTIASKRVSRAADFAVMLEEAAGLSPDDLLRAVEQSDEHAELLATAWDAASRAPDERKRRLLARAAAQGITTDGAKIDDVPLIVRTLDELEPVHMKLLEVLRTVRVVQNGSLRVMGAMTTKQVVEEWPEARESVEPIMAMLIREGLVLDVSVTQEATGFGGSLWSLSPYGERFYAFIVRDDGPAGAEPQSG